eukprot:CAMPEP_0179347794 /NCGR_PEP_ID=MMETSP0797-20121207/73346_1 /TAXON_ID=47934 /ORGANISM="Dinophysis acuminata, Strain DAEP01" /LENGTH=106 /DNA_ID=CAMNT_0021062531 /DNA_START=28 /DNA_END=344 /DNA_ORIENTATION=-
MHAQDVHETAGFRACSSEPVGSGGFSQDAGSQPIPAPWPWAAALPPGPPRPGTCDPCRGRRETRVEACLPPHTRHRGGRWDGAAGGGVADVFVGAVTSPGLALQDP